MDYERDTGHLSLEEDCCYRRLLDALWKRDAQPLPDDDLVLARLIRVDMETWKRVRPVMQPFFDITTQGWISKRLFEVYTWCIAKMQADHERGKKMTEARLAKQAQERDEQRHVDKPKSKSKSKSNSEVNPNAKAVPKRLGIALETELMQRTEKLVGPSDMQAHGGLWRTLMRKHPNTYIKVLEEIESMAKEQDIPGRQFIKSPGAAFIDLYKRWKN
jgi:uncharacterized protein YdaU (DUF1376 family)